MNFIIFKYLYLLLAVFLLLNHKIAWSKVNGPIQLALRSKIIILILLIILLVLESYMSLVIMRITPPGIRIP